MTTGRINQVALANEPPPSAERPWTGGLFSAPKIRDERQKQDINPLAVERLKRLRTNGWEVCAAVLHAAGRKGERKTRATRIAGNRYIGPVRARFGLGSQRVRNASHLGLHVPSKSLATRASAVQHESGSACYGESLTPK